MSAGGSGMSGSAAMANPMVGGAAMYPTKDIVDNAVNSKDHTTLVAAVKAAGPGRHAQEPGPVSPCSRRPTTPLPCCRPRTVDTLLKPENKPMLTKVLT